MKEGKGEKCYFPSIPKKRTTHNTIREETGTTAVFLRGKGMEAAMHAVTRGGGGLQKRNPASDSLVECLGEGQTEQSDPGPRNLVRDARENRSGFGEPGTDPIMGRPSRAI